MTSALKGDCPSDKEISEIPSYIFCQWLSGNPSTITIANFFNYFNKIPVKNQYDVVRAIFHNKIRYIPYPKTEKEETIKNLEYIQRYFNVNTEIAKQYLEVISEKEMAKIARAYQIMENR
jgi:hypothetical protein